MTEQPIEPDSPEERQWVAHQRDRVEAYLQTERLAPATVEAEPELLMAPVLALWEVRGEGAAGEASESGEGEAAGQDARRWWVISGDLPTDHVAWERGASVREALATLAKKWRTAASVMAARADTDNADGASPEQSQQAAAHLFQRAKMLHELVDHEALWGA